jgi:hypothetical protein
VICRLRFAGNIKIMFMCPKFLVNFRNKLIFYGEELLAPRPTPKL